MRLKYIVALLIFFISSVNAKWENNNSNTSAYTYAEGVIGVLNVELIDSTLTPSFTALTGKCLPSVAESMGTSVRKVNGQKVRFYYLSGILGCKNTPVSEGGKSFLLDVILTSDEIEIEGYKFSGEGAKLAIEQIGKEPNIL